ncbi:MAG: methyltransferase, partial [Paramuribaculum sp.]|nr:methyltransferase [Paramuribaculum sp.]
MGNNRNRESFFRFKKFSVRDSAGAMKIGTDGVLLGAWVPVSGVKRAIDIGCGTGLIAIMLAQRGVERVVGVEIAENAAAESKENVANCVWNKTIEIVTGDATTLNFDNYQPELIVSNPPFFSKS